MGKKNTKIIDTSIKDYDVSFTYFAPYEDYGTDILQLEYRDNSWFVWAAFIEEDRPDREKGRPYEETINEWLYDNSDKGCSCAYSGDFEEVLRDRWTFGGAERHRELKELYIKASNKIIMGLQKAE